MNILTEIREKKEDSYQILDDASSSPDTDIIQSPENRRKTDKIFLIVFAACIVLLFPFLIYTLCYSDINRLKDYDFCGNICGQKNVKYEQWNCTGQDMTLKPIVAVGGTCIERTDDYYSPDVFLTGEDVPNFFHRAAWKILLVSFVPLAFCLIVIVLFRYVPAVAVWGILISSWILFTAVGLLLICMHLQHALPVIIFSIIALLLLCSWILFNLSKIRLIIVLLKEATRASFEVKKLCYVAFGTSLVLLIILIAFTITTFHLSTAGKLTEIYSGRLVYRGDNMKPTTLVLNTIIALWAIFFVIGVHDMAVSGVFTKWYADKNQDSLNDDVPISVLNTFKYHLGTIALGSILALVMFIPRLILSFLAMFSAMKEKADLWSRYLDGFFTSYTYFMTAKYGTSFVQSGKKAVRLLKLSIGDTIYLNSFGNFVIMAAQCLVIFTSAMGAYITLYYKLGWYGKYSEVFAYVEFAIASICAHTMLGPFKIALNTIFLNASEEFLNNKEADLPYTMTIKELVDGSNKLYLQKVQNRPPSNIVKKSILIKVSFFIFIGVSCTLFFVAYFI